MSDFTANLKPVRQGPARSVEYGVYFGLIFLVCLPGVALGRAAAALHGDFAGPGLLRRARSRAREITPRIFDA